MLACNDLSVLKKVFGKTASKDDDFVDYFKNSSNKTKVALKIFESDKGAVKFPQYIEDAISE